MKRRLLKLGLMLIAGAIVNVAVAWGSAVTSFAIGASRTDRLVDQWARTQPPDFPNAQPLLLRNDMAAGYRQISCVAFGPRRLIERSDWPGKLTTHDAIWMQSIYQCGLPLLSLEWVGHYSNEIDLSSDGTGWQFSGLAPPAILSDGRDASRRLAYHPLWPGFAINTIFYAAILWVVWFTPGMVRRRIRRRRGLCPACAYPIGSSPICTECGNPLKIRTCMGLPPPATPATDRERTT